MTPPPSTTHRWVHWRCSQQQDSASITFDFRAFVFTISWVVGTVFGICWLVARQIPPAGRELCFLLPVFLLMGAALQLTWQLVSPPPFLYEKPADLLKLPRLHLEITGARARVVFQIVLRSSDEGESSDLHVVVDGTCHKLLGSNNSLRSIKQTWNWLEQLGFPVRLGEGAPTKSGAANAQP